MFKKIMLTMALGLLFVPAMVSYAASDDGFVSETESKLITHDFRWGVVVYRLEAERKEKIFDETLDKAVAQKDGSYLSYSDKVTVLEPNASYQSNDIIILRIDNIDVGNKKYSETFTYEKGDMMSYRQKSSDKALLVELHIRPTKDDNVRDDKPDYVFY